MNRLVVIEYVTFFMNYRSLSYDKNKKEALWMLSCKNVE